MNITKNALLWFTINVFILLKFGINFLCFVFVTCLSKNNNKLGKIVSTEIIPSNTPLAITIPRSVPNVNFIVHSTRKPAIVVKDDPTTDVNVSEMAFSIASSLLIFSFLSS